jgi:hypothetical protein
MGKPRTLEHLFGRCYNPSIEIAGLKDPGGTEFYSRAIALSVASSLATELHLHLAATDETLALSPVIFSDGCGITTSRLACAQRLVPDE